MVTLTTTPNDWQPIGNDFEFGFTISASGDGADLVYSIGYQLFDEDDIAITELEQIPYSSGEQFVNFARDIKPYIYTTLQDPGADPTLDFDTNFGRGFYIQYGQIEFDSANCTTETSGVGTSSDQYEAMNCAFQWWEDYGAFASGDMVVLSDRPAENYVTADQDIFLHIFRDITDNLIVFRLNYDSAGNQIGSTELLTEVSQGAHVHAVSAFPDDPLHVGLARWRILVNETLGDTTIKTYNFTIRQCGDSPIRELHWIEPKGTQSSLVFEDVVIGGNQAAGSTFETRVPRGLTNVQRGKDYGLSRSNVKGFKRVTFRSVMDQVDGLEVWLDGLFSSRHHYVKYPVSNSYIMAKFVIDDGGYETYNENQLAVTVAGTIHIPINAL